MTPLLEVRLGDMLVGKLHLITGDRSVFTFEEEYLSDPGKPVLSQSFFAYDGKIITQGKLVQTKLPPFFSNLLPEGYLRKYLAKKGRINPNREFKLIELLGEDLPGAVRIRPSEGLIHSLESEKESSLLKEKVYRFSLAGIQLKFSAMAKGASGLTIPAKGVGGDWIIKLPAQNFREVPENEWSMLNLAKVIGISVPEVRLVELNKISNLPDVGVLIGNKGLAVKRFDRGNAGHRIHIEDFAQVYGIYPGDKYNKINYTGMAKMVWMLTGQNGLVDFIRRLVFSIMIGNGDMHLKNWSFIYHDKITPNLAPAYDYVSTIPYIPNDRLALNLSKTKVMSEISYNHFERLIQKAQLPSFIVLETVKETVTSIREAWDQNQQGYPLSKSIRQRITSHMASILL